MPLRCNFLMNCCMMTSRLDVIVSFVSRDRDSYCRSHIRYMVTTKLTGAAICQKYLLVVSKDC